MKQEHNQGRKVVWLTNAASALAILACYGTALVAASLASAGVAVAVHQGLWAAAITLFALAAFVFTLFGYHHYGQMGPALAAAASIALLIWALFVSYDWRIELAGFCGLALAAAWQRRLAERQINGG